jgi:hypothetical protein
MMWMCFKRESMLIDDTMRVRVAARAPVKQQSTSEQSTRKRRLKKIHVENKRHGGLGHK